MLEKDKQLSTLHEGEMFELLVSCIKEYAIYALDPHGYIISWNEGAERIKGYSRSEIVGKHFSIFFSPDDVESGKPDYELKYALEEGRFEDEGWRRRKDGSRFWANVVITPIRDADGVLLGFGKVTRDLTEWQKAKIADQDAIRLKAQTDSFAVLADASPTLVFCADVAGEWTYANKRWCDFTGQTETDTYGGGWLKAVHLDDREAVKQAWFESIHSGNPFSIDFRLNYRNTQEFRWFNSKALPHDTSDGRILRWVGGCTDIEETRRAKELLERRVRERTAQLEKANGDLQIARDRAIEASSIKSKFVANISHEIRTPMSGVLGMSELLLTCPLDAEARELAQYIYTSARSLLDVVNDLLDFSKLEAGKLSITRMRFAIDKVTKEVSQTTSVVAAQKGLTYDINVERGLPEVYGDPGRIRQILLNLVHNAIKFTAKGNVAIDVRSTQRTKNALTVRFTVTDTGIGISEESRDHLFNPFEQADGSTTRKYGGTGLGLSISKSLTQLMLGEIGFDSEEGKGSTFWFEVPLELA